MFAHHDLCRPSLVSGDGVISGQLNIALTLLLCFAEPVLDVMELGFIEPVLDIAQMCLLARLGWLVAMAAVHKEGHAGDA